MSTVDAQSGKLKVFVSYSREDAAFADELVDGLDLTGFDTTIDRHSILEGEDWKKRLGALIADADTVIFVLSPASVTSEICTWEVEEAYRLSKRILPVLWRPVGETPVPPRLAALNFVRFDGDRPFVAALRALGRALESDIDWLREHTRLLARAMEWNRGGRSENRLLSGRDIDEAKQWVARRPKDAPEPTTLHLDFIRQSELAEAARQSEEARRLQQMAAATAAREEALKAAEIATQEKALASRRMVQRTLAGAAVALLFAVAAGAAAFYAFEQRTRARNEAGRAQTALETADQQRKAAEDQKRIAEQQTRIARKQRELLAPGPLIETKLGNIDAPIVVIEYSSVTCPHCGNYRARTFPKIKEQYIDKGTVLYISREFPLDDLSAAAYLLARCRKTDQSFALIQGMLRDQEKWLVGAGTQAERLYSIVKGAGFSRQDFDRCLSDQELLDAVSSVRRRANEKHGVNAVPTFFINEHKLVGNHELKDFEAIFAGYLNPKN
jgi:protein-disulfide isomerase